MLNLFIQSVNKLLENFYKMFRILRVCAHIYLPKLLSRIGGRQTGPKIYHVSMPKQKLVMERDQRRVGLVARVAAN